MLCSTCVFKGRPPYKSPCANCDMVEGSPLCKFEEQKMEISLDKLNGGLPCRKKAKKKTPKKSNHKHEYQPCVLGFEIMVYDLETGQRPKPSNRIATYCPHCGKIGTTDFDRWYTWVSTDPPAGRYEYTVDAKKELNPATRTLPLFHVDDEFFSTFVNLEELNEQS